MRKQSVTRSNNFFFIVKFSLCIRIFAKVPKSMRPRKFIRSNDSAENDTGRRINISRERKRRIARSNLRARWRRRDAKAIFERGYSTPSVGILAFFGCTRGGTRLSCIMHARGESRFRLGRDRRACEANSSKSARVYDFAQMAAKLIQARELNGGEAIVRDRNNGRKLR